MKMIQTIDKVALDLALAFLTIALVFMGVTGCFTGCSSTPAAVSYKVEGTTINTVDTAMRAWADWVGQGNATSNQVQTVRQAYYTYYAAQLAAKAALEAYLAAASPAGSNTLAQATQSATQAAGALAGIVQELIAPPLPKK